MATLIELAEAGHLERLVGLLESHEQEVRCIYVFPHVVAQIEALDGQASPTGAELKPLEQFYGFAAEFVSGAEMETPSQFHDLRHREDGIWELKTTDLRFFGWFYCRDVFIVTDVKDATFVKHGPPGIKIAGSLYPGFGSEVVRRRNELDLDPPKFVEGKHPEDVVSNYVTR